MAPHDSTFLLGLSEDVWQAEWFGAAIYDHRDWLGGWREYRVPVRRKDGAPRPEPPEGFDRVVSNGRKTWTLKHASMGCTVVILEVEVPQWVARRTGEDGRTVSQRVPEPMPFKADGKRRYTRHFEDQVGRMMSGFGNTVKTCARFCHAAPLLVKDIDLRRLRLLAGSMKPAHHARYIAIDEFKIAKPRRFCTIVVDAQTGELLYLRRGKTKQQVYAFFRWVGEEFMSHVEAVAMDMNTNYSAAFRDRYPGIEVVWDAFHVVKNYNDKVLDPLRRSQARALLKRAAELEEAGDAEGAQLLRDEKRLLFGMRHNILANRRTLEAKDRLNAELNREAKEQAERDGRDPSEVGRRRTDNVERLDRLVEANEKIGSAIKARSEFQEILGLTDADEMRARLEAWVAQWSKARILQLTNFCKMVTKRMDGLVARARHGISSGILEGTNALVKAIMRQTFGMQDFDYFGLKVWEKTHMPNGTRRFEPGDADRPRRKYVRKAPRNKRRAKQTIYMDEDEGAAAGKGAA